MDIEVVAPPHGVADQRIEKDDVPGGDGDVETKVEKDDVLGGDEDEEIRQPKIVRRPMLPTKAEVDEHYPLHLHYRSWCRHCRAGKARLAPYLVESADRERLGVTFSADYAFMAHSWVPKKRTNKCSPVL